MLTRAALLLVAIGAATVCQAWYIPGVSPQSYAKDDLLDIKVNALTSNQGVMPFPFYSFKNCAPTKETIKLQKKKENIGELLWGDQIEPSVYTASMAHNVTCRKLCEPLTYDANEMKALAKLIEQQYRGNLILDNLPVAQETHAGPRLPKLLIGFPLGLPARLSPKKEALINNHLHFKILIHEDELAPAESTDQSFRIVGFYVSAMSLKYDNVNERCAEGKPFEPENLEPLTTAATEVAWTYSVSFIEDEHLPWGTRWDVYLKGGEHDDRIHWFAIINSLLVVVFLSTIVAMIMLRLLHKDFNRYNNPENPNEAQEETGWKLVHTDVCRTPSHPALLAAVIGSGSQLLCMAALTLAFACLGFLSPSNRGALLTAVILLYVLLGSYAGYVAARLCKLFGVPSWKNAFLAGTILPGVVFAVYFLLNLVQWYKHASSAVRFTTLILLFALWMCVSLPLVIVGAAIGYRRDVLSMPTRVAAYPRLVPVQQWYLQNWFVIPACGIMPFGAAFIELVYILSSFWQGRVYYVFGFLALVFIILVITCAEVTVVLVYFQLCYENYHWWWRSFLMAGSAGLHLYLYSIYYLATVLTIRQPTSVMLYLGYMLLISTMFGVACGTVGFLSSFQFVRVIYGRIKID
jgi:transmembrane 9 superfamily protein 2/4